MLHRTLGDLAARPLRPEQRLDLFCASDQVEAVRSLAPGAAVRAVDGPFDVAEALERERFDLLYCPLLTLDPVAPGIPSAVWIPDLVHEIHPELLDEATLVTRRRYYRASALNADVVFTGSEHAKSTMVERLGVAAEKVRVILHGVDPEWAAGDCPPPPGLPSEYLYYPANFWPHKNHEVLLRALAALRRRGRRIDLALTGSPDSGWPRVQEAAARLGVGEQVHFLGMRSRGEVAAIYRGARALTFPSLFEGFGLPPLEAMQLGTPVIASAAGSVPEVVADAALLVDPLDAEALAAAIERTLDDEALRRTLIAAGRRRAASMRWEDSLPSFRSGLLDAVGRTRRKPAPLRIAVITAPDEGAPDADAWKRAEGDAFCFLRSDETLLPGALEKAGLALANAPGVAGAYGHLDRAGNIVQADRFRFEDLAGRGQIYRPAAFLRRDAIEAAGGIDASRREAWFFDLLLRIGFRQPLLRLDEPLAVAGRAERRRRLRFLRRAVKLAAGLGDPLPTAWVLSLSRELFGPLSWPAALPIGLWLLPAGGAISSGIGGWR